MSNFINSFGFENQIETILGKKIKNYNKRRKKNQNYRNLSNKIIKNS